MKIKCPLENCEVVPIEGSHTIKKIVSTIPEFYKQFKYSTALLIMSGYTIKQVK
jgi:hypothetical protein